MYSQAELSKIIQDGIEAIEYSNNAPRLFDPVRYTLESGGKRVRPTLVLMATNLFADDITPAIAPALGLEIYHNFTLLHDDVMDKAPDRRGRPTVHVKWNDNTAILSGDAMLSMAFEHICKTCDDKLRPILDLFTRTTIEIGEGQQLDMEFETRNDVTEEEYIEMIRLKTSVLLGCALKMGAIIGNAPESDSEILYRFGINIGLAFQLQDDLLDSFGDPATFGKAIGGDIMENKKTYMLISALSKADSSQRREMQNWMSNPDPVRVKSITSGPIRMQPNSPRKEFENGRNSTEISRNPGGEILNNEESASSGAGALDSHG